MEDFIHRCSYYEKKFFGTVNEYWAKVIKCVRAREFFAEFLGTFVLIVSYSVTSLVPRPLINAFN